MLPRVWSVPHKRGMTPNHKEIKMSDDDSRTAGKRRVVVVVNKWWEFEPVMNVLLNDNARPAAELGWPTLLNFPARTALLAPPPRAAFDLDHVQAELWCISDLLASYAEKFQSSSEKKMDRLPLICMGPGRPAPDLVIAMGTAACPLPVNKNGSVVVGTGVFMHDGHPESDPNPLSKWRYEHFDEVVSSSLEPRAFDAIAGAFDREEALKRFLPPPLNPDPAGPEILAAHEYVALGSVNVTDYTEYDAKDKETLDAFTASHPLADGPSLETTHGLIRVASGHSPFMFISGIVDRAFHFHEDVSPRSYAQNTCGAHNAGIVLAWLLPKIDEWFAHSE